MWNRDTQDADPWVNSTSMLFKGMLYPWILHLRISFYSKQKKFKGMNRICWDKKAHVRTPQFVCKSFFPLLILAKDIHLCTVLCSFIFLINGDLILNSSLSWTFNFLPLMSFLLSLQKFWRVIKLIHSLRGKNVSCSNMSHSYLFRRWRGDPWWPHNTHGYF